MASIPTVEQPLQTLKCLADLSLNPLQLSTISKAISAAGGRCCLCFSGTSREPSAETFKDLTVEGEAVVEKALLRIRARCKFSDYSFSTGLGEIGNPITQKTMLFSSDSLEEILSVLEQEPMPHQILSGHTSFDTAYLNNDYPVSQGGEKPMVCKQKNKPIVC